jgi:squalene-hopene/tetraprenyl-beta-curcumene cyclase
MLWSLNSAGRLGLDVDRKEISERTAWAVDWRHWNKSGDKEGVDKVSAGNVHTMVSLLLGREARAEQDAEWMREFRAQLVKNQQADGSWKGGGQVPTGRRPARETVEVSTMWTLLALNSYGDRGADADLRKRADAFLASAQPGRSTEWHVLKLLLDPGSESVRAELLRQQHPDGGWGWLTADPSDAFGTGLALYALAAAAFRPRRSLPSAPSLF